MSEESGVRITVRDVYDQVIEMKALLGPLVDPVTGVVATQKDHESRLRALEKSRWPLPSLALLVSLASIFVNLTTPWR